jgi:glycine betaine/proline transport system permease protein
MLALSMVVITALIGAGGLGETVYVGLGRNDVGFAAIGGIGIVVLAIILDRLTQAITKPRSHRRNPLFMRWRSWYRSRRS